MINSTIDGWMEIQNPDRRRTLRDPDHHQNHGSKLPHLRRRNAKRCETGIWSCVGENLYDQWISHHIQRPRNHCHCAVIRANDILYVRSLDQNQISSCEHDYYPPLKYVSQSISSIAKSHMNKATSQRTLPSATPTPQSPAYVPSTLRLYQLLRTWC